MKSKIPTEITDAIDALIRNRIKHFDAYNMLHCMKPPKRMIKGLKAELMDLEDNADKQLHIIHEGLSRIFQ